MHTMNSQEVNFVQKERMEDMHGSHCISLPCLQKRPTGGTAEGRRAVNDWIVTGF